MKKLSLVFVFAVLALLALLVVPSAGAQCVGFDGLAAGTTWGASAGHASGDLVHVENGVRVSVHHFSWTSGGTLGDALVDASWQTSPPNSVNTNNVNLGFDFSALPSLPTQAAIKFRDLGGFENLSINGSPITVGELASGAGGGLSWTVADFPTPGGRIGKLTVYGPVHSLLVGGQEFWLDTLCVTSDPAGGVDHFKVYDVEDREVEAEVMLRGQFDGREPTAAKLRAVTHFANPVSKNGEPFVDPFAHLTFYRIEEAERARERTVVVGNQFNRQILRLGPALFLLVPTEKIEERSRFPEGLDHYKCYAAKGESVNREVTLRDQFGGAKGRVGAPRLFCVPAEKWHGKKHFPIFDRITHLTFYELESEPEERKIETRDQFGAHVHVVLMPELLGVPTRKLYTSDE